MERDEVVNRLILIGLVILFLILGFLILRPILLSVFVGLILSYLFYPAYKKINMYVSNRDLATIILIVLTVLVIVVPLWITLPILTKQTFEAYNFFQKVNFGHILVSIAPSQFNEDYLLTISGYLDNLFITFFQSIFSIFSQLISDLPNLLLKFGVVIFTFYFSTRDAEALKEYMVRLSPFSDSTEKSFLKEFKHITDTIIYGQFLIGTLQGLLLGLGLFILGVPNVIILTFLTVVFAVIPMFGTGFVWLPASIYLMTEKSVFLGVVLLLYGALFISTIDNFLRPYFLSRGSRLPVIVALIGTIGGIYAFGIAGLVLGPLVLAYILMIIDFYREKKLNELFKQNIFG